MEIYNQNPFITANPVRGEDFFGRKEIIDNIISFLKNKTGINYFIYGQRRMGKTSILKKIENTAQLLGLAHPVYFNVQDKARTSLDRLLYEISTGINDELDLKIAVEEKNFSGLEAPRYFTKNFIPAVMAKMGENQILAVLLDEFDVLTHRINNDSDSNSRLHEIASKRFIPFMEALSQEIREKKYPVKFIFTVGNNYKTDRERLEKLTQYGSQVHLSYFTKAETEQLLKNFSQPSIPFDKDAIDDIYALTSGHPYFTQCLAGDSFDGAVENKKKRVTPDIVKHRLMNTLKKHSSAVYWVWDSFDENEKMILYLLARLKEENLPVDIEHIRKKAFAINAGPALENLPQALDKLENIGFIKQVDRGGQSYEYDFYVELIRIWIINKFKDRTIGARSWRLAKKSFMI